jgi:hypothetical protein
MLTKKLASLGLTMAMTASLSLLAGCPAPTPTEPSASASASADPSADASASVAPSASASAPSSFSFSSSASAAPSGSASAPAPSGSASATPVANSSTTPTDTTGITSDIKEKATFNGTIYDTNGVPVDGAKVVATSIDPSVTWKGEDQITAGGSYVFRNAPVGVRVLITVSKDGWTTRTQTQVLKSNLTGNPDANKFDFEDKDAIQDEPEVISVKINDKAVTGAGKILTSEDDYRPLSNTSANLSAVDSSNLKFEFGFSEAVDKEDFENAFILYSQEFERDNADHVNDFTTDIDSGLNEITFDWSSDRKSVTVKTNKPVLANKTGDEARYNLYLPNNALTDDTGKNAFSHNSGNTQGVIRLASKTTTDNVVFSVKNDVDGPMLLGVTAKSGGGSDDTVELRFSEPLDVAGFTSPTANLNIDGDGFVNEIRHATADGFSAGLLLLGSNGDDVFGLAQVEEQSTSGIFDISNDLGDFDLTKVKVEGSKVMIELESGALMTGKKLVVSVGRTPKVNGISFGSGSFVQLQDPAGNDIEAGNTSTSAKIEVSGVQRASTVN